MPLTQLTTDIVYPSNAFKFLDLLNISEGSTSSSSSSNCVDFSHLFRANCNSNCSYSCSSCNSCSSSRCSSKSNCSCSSNTQQQLIEPVFGVNPSEDFFCSIKNFNNKNDLFIEESFKV